VVPYAQPVHRPTSTQKREREGGKVPSSLGTTRAKTVVRPDEKGEKRKGRSYFSLSISKPPCARRARHLPRGGGKKKKRRGGATTTPSSGILHLKKGEKEERGKPLSSTLLFSKRSSSELAKGRKEKRKKLSLLPHLLALHGKFPPAELKRKGEGKEAATRLLELPLAGLRKGVAPKLLKGKEKGKKPLALCGIRSGKYKEKHVGSVRTAPSRASAAVAEGQKERKRSALFRIDRLCNLANAGREKKDAGSGGAARLGSVP